MFGLPPFSSLVRARKRLTVNGMVIARIPRHQPMAATAGCCRGQAASAGVAVGLPNRVRTAAMTALNGFHSAIVCRPSGRPAAGTNELAYSSAYRSRTVTRTATIRSHRYRAHVKLPSSAWRTAKVTVRYPGTATRKAATITRTVRQRRR